MQRLIKIELSPADHEAQVYANRLVAELYLTFWVGIMFTLVIGIMNPPGAFFGLILSPMMHFWVTRLQVAEFKRTVERVLGVSLTEE